MQLIDGKASARAIKEEIKAEVDKLCGGVPDKPKFTDELIGVVKWVDGTVIDSVFRVKE